MANYLEKASIIYKEAQIATSRDMCPDCKKIVEYLGEDDDPEGRESVIVDGRYKTRVYDGDPESDLPRTCTNLKLGCRFPNCLAASLVELEK